MRAGIGPNGDQTARGSWFRNPGSECKVLPRQVDHQGQCPGLGGMSRVWDQVPMTAQRLRATATGPIRPWHDRRLSGEPDPMAMWRQIVERKTSISSSFESALAFG